jgi:hypothetical protein
MKSKVFQLGRPEQRMQLSEEYVSTSDASACRFAGTPEHD